MKIAYLINSVEEYGKFISYCIEKDISVFRTYWDEREKGYRCYAINWIEKRCYYCTRAYYENAGYTVINPSFYEIYGTYHIDLGDFDNGNSKNRKNA